MTGKLSGSFDHLIVRADDAQPLFQCLSETLKLPIAWPWIE